MPGVLVAGWALRTWCHGRLRTPRPHNVGVGEVAATEFALVFAGDEAFGQGLAVAMHSALANLASGVHPDVCVLDNGLSEFSRSRLRKVVRAARSIDDVRWIPTAREHLGDVAAGSHLTPATYSRLLIPALLPGHIRRAIYLDADVIVRGDISPLFTIDLRGAPTGAVRDSVITSTVHEKSGVRERADPRPYFNLGVLVIDVARWRVEGVGERALRYAEAGEPLRWADQDALNALSLDWHELDFRWNVAASGRDLRVLGKRRAHPQIEGRLYRGHIRLRRAARVVHFVGPMKPWEHRSLRPGTGAWVCAMLRTRWYSPREAFTWLLRRQADTIVAVGRRIGRTS